MKAGANLAKWIHFSFTTILFSLTSVFLLYTYRIGGSKVDRFSEVPGLRDLGVYIEAGNRIINRDSPYQTNGTRFGTFAALPFSILDNLSTGLLLGIFWQALSVALILFFAHSVRTFLDLKVNNLVLLPILWFSSFRENLVTNQVTCIIAAFFGLILILFKHNKWTFLSRLLILFSTSFLIDIKPHLTLAPLILIFFFHEKRALFVQSCVLLLVLHILIDIWVGRILELEWLRIVLELAGSNRPTFTDSQAFWPFLLDLGFGKLIIQILSIMVIFVLIICLYFARRTLGVKKYLAMSFLIPSFSTYFHYYDLIIVAVVVYLMVLSKNVNWQSFKLSAAISVLVVGTSFSSLELQLISIALCFFTVFILFGYKQLIDYFQTLLGIVLGKLLDLIIMIVKDDSVHVAKTSMTIIVLFLILLLNQESNSLSIPSFRKKDSKENPSGTSQN